MINHSQQAHKEQKAVNRELQCDPLSGKDKYENLNNISVKQETECDPLQVNSQQMNNPILNNIKSEKSECEKNFQCEFCNKKFLEFCELKIHLYIHDRNIGLKDEKCDVCNNTFKGLTSLKIHKETAHSVVNYKCKLCNKFFSQIGHLNKHVKVIHEKTTGWSNRVFTPSTV